MFNCLFKNIWNNRIKENYYYKSTSNNFGFANPKYFTNILQLNSILNNYAKVSPTSFNRYTSEVASPEVNNTNKKERKQLHNTTKLRSNNRKLTDNIKTIKKKKRFYRKVYFPNASLNVILQYRDAKQIIKDTTLITKKLVNDKKKSIENESPLSKVLSEVQITQPHAMKDQLRFRVPVNMNKLEIRNYLRNIYGLDLNFVNTANYLGPFKRARVRVRALYKKKDHKKAFVSINNWISELSPLANKMKALFGKNRYKSEEETAEKK